jgi:hypothetical protein
MKTLAFSSDRFPSGRKSLSPGKAGSILSMTAFALLFWCGPWAHAQVFEADSNTNQGVEEFDLNTGALINSQFASDIDAVDLISSGSSFYVANFYGTVGEYSVDGSSSNSSLITGVTNPVGLALSGNDLYVADQDDGIIGEYNATTGQAINSRLITGQPGGDFALAISGNTLYVSNYTADTIAEYNATSGQAINTSFITGVDRPMTIVISGSNLLVGNQDAGTVAEYSLSSGALENATFISGVSELSSMTISNGDLYVAGNGIIGIYNATTGATINADFSSGETGEPYGIAVFAAPEPSTWMMVLGGMISFGICSKRRRARG